MEEGKLSTKTAVVLVIAAVAVIGFFWLFVNSSGQNPARVTNYDVNAGSGTVPPAALPSDPSLGPNDAKFTLIEFGDYECPACAATSGQLIQLLRKRNDVRLVWKDYPLAGHANSESAAVAARCAGDQGKYWQFAETLFANQDSLGSSLYLKAAADLKLNTESFSSCFSSGRHKNEIAAAAAMGDAAGIDYLPYLFINGQPYAGNIDAEELNAALSVLK